MINFVQVMWDELQKSVWWHLRWYLLAVFAFVQAFKWLFANW